MVGSPGEENDTARLMSRALAHMRLALELLDRAKAPADIGAHLDLAVVRLEESVDFKPVTFRPRR